MTNFNTTNVTTAPDPGATIVAIDALSGGLIFNGLVIVVLLGLLIVYYRRTRDIPSAMIVGGSAGTGLGVVFLLAGVLEPATFFLSLSVLILGIIGLGFSKT